MNNLLSLLGDEAESLLSHRCEKLPKQSLTLPSSDYIARVFSDTDRPNTVLRNYQSILDHGRLGGSGYISILPVDQGIEHSASASFAQNPIYFDPKNIVELAIEGGCSAVCSTRGHWRRYRAAMRTEFPLWSNSTTTMA